MEKGAILKVNNLGISFTQYTKGLRRQELKVIDNLDIELYEGEILAVVGSSGSGKSLLANAILGILPENAALEGGIYYKGGLLYQRDKEKLRGREIALIPQSVNSLDPLRRVGDQIGLSIKNRKERDKIIENIFQKYDLEKEVVNYYPYQLSGGMTRKILLATVLACDAKLIIADEPTPGLDEFSLKEILEDFRELADRGRALLMITHDIKAALMIADKIAIFYAGTTLEIADAKDFNGDGNRLRHPYTKALNQARADMEFLPIKGTQPFPSKLPSGCLFSDRCSVKSDRCQNERPELRLLRGGKVRCFNAT